MTQGRDVTYSHALECYTYISITSSWPCDDVSLYENYRFKITDASPHGPMSWCCDYSMASQWCHNECQSVSNHRRLYCLINRLFWRRSNKTSKLWVTGLCEGNPPVTGGFPSQRASYTESVFIWWCHNDTCIWQVNITSQSSCVRVTHQMDLAPSYITGHVRFCYHWDSYEQLPFFLASWKNTAWNFWFSYNIYFAALVINYGISNTFVLEIP